MTQEEHVHVPKIITQTRVRRQPVEQVVEAGFAIRQNPSTPPPLPNKSSHRSCVKVPVPMTQEEQVHVPKIITQTRIMHQHVEQVVEAG